LSGPQWQERKAKEHGEKQGAIWSTEHLMLCTFNKSETYNRVGPLGESKTQMA